MNGLESFLPWLNLILLVILPTLWAASARLQRIESAIQSHAAADRIEHETVRRDLERVDMLAQRAHARLDRLRAPAP